MLPTPTPQPPLSPYGTLMGQLFLYGANRVAFESLPQSWFEGAGLGEPNANNLSPTPPACANKCILLGGLSDGLLPTPYTAGLEEACRRAGGQGGLEGSFQQPPQSWSLVQPVLSSSYTGFGHGRLSRDTEELEELIHYLQIHRHAQRIAFVGHSTGCQNIMHYLQHRQKKQQEERKQRGQHYQTVKGYSGDGIVFHSCPIVLVVLQAPVSDREHAAIANPELYHRMLEHARALLVGEQAPTNSGNDDDTSETGTTTNSHRRLNGNEMMPREAFWAPITAQRYLDLHERGGMDDYFSSDYTDQELYDRLGHVGTTTRRCLVAFSGKDEYVPGTVNAPELLHRLVRAMNQGIPDTDSTIEGYQQRSMVAEGLFLETGNHNLSQESSDKSKFLQRVTELLQESLLDDNA